MLKKDVVIMATGGMDSTVLLYKAKAEQRAGRIGNISIITVNYGQAVFQIQVDMIGIHTDLLNLPGAKIISIDFPEWQGKSNLFSGNAPDEENPLEDWDQLRYANAFVEGRNMIMVAYAMAFASSIKAHELWAGYLYAENEWLKRRSYKLMTGDNSPQFVDAINIMASMGFSHQVRFRAPFYESGVSKQDVYDIGRDDYGIDFKHTYSCYYMPSCGKCDNCLLREQVMGDSIRTKLGNFLGLATAVIDARIKNREALMLAEAETYGDDLLAFYRDSEHLIYSHIKDEEERDDDTDWQDMVDSLDASGLDAYTTILDFGCGIGSAGRNLLDRISKDWDIKKVYCYEMNRLSSRFIDTLKNPKLELTDETFGMFDRKYNLIIAWGVFEHIKDSDAGIILRNLLSVLVPGGKIFMKNFYSDETEYRFHFRKGPIMTGLLERNSDKIVYAKHSDILFKESYNV